jgi:hypothetical protein
MNPKDMLANPIDLLRDVALKKIVGSVVRLGLASLGTMLVENGLAEKADVTELAVRASPWLAALLLSLIEKAIARRTTKVALAMPGGSTEPELHVEMKDPLSPYKAA